MKSQRGYVVPLLLMMIVLGALAWGFDAEQIGQLLTSARAERTRGSLAQVADAVAGYAAFYPESHATPRYGLLPCPDRNGDGSSDLNCGTAAEFVIGTVPYRTLGIAPPEDGSGNCIWYAVSGNYKTKSSATGVFNWDALGQFEVASASGPLLAGDTPHSLAVAVLIAPGRPLPGVSRAGLGAACTLAASAIDVAGFLESPGGAAAAALERFTQGNPDDDANNDLITWLAPTDVFRRLERSSYFVQFLNDRLQAAVDLLSPLSAPPPLGTLVGGVAIGPLPAVAEFDVSVRPQGNAKVMYEDWAPMFRYLRCADDSACLQSNGAPCRVVIAFGGARTDGQQRDTAAAQNDPDQYFEGANRDAMHAPALGFSGPSVIDMKPPSQDVLRCIA